MQSTLSFLFPAFLLALVSATSGAVIPRHNASDVVTAIFDSPNGAIGACGFAIQNADFAIALSPADFANGANCGKPAFVSNGGASITVTVADICKECTNGGVKLTSGVEVLTGQTGPIPVTWHIKVFPPAVKITGAASPFKPTTDICTGDVIPSTEFVVALSNADLAGGSTCEQEVDITFNNKTISTTARAECAECAPGEIQVSSNAFASLTGSTSAKSVEVVWSIPTVGV
ncbi:hypothetical protein C8F04DRAFT_1002987 [Mycena alexandri]|uniref:Uncharacterized protein n=1 Tax=Mycena alexandri TaxID=1745969 RepID=A0AAD6SVL2_9AGAR|nr:hypothetical protein C8F04DRAFT_1002987 [Mycena alexandri]